MTHTYTIELENGMVIEVTPESREGVQAPLHTMIKGQYKVLEVTAKED